MGLDFSKASHEAKTTVSLDALRGQTMQRLAGVQQRLGDKGVGAAFMRSAKADPMGDMGCLGSLLVDMIFCGPFSAMLDSSGISESFNGMSVVAGLEGVAALRDEKAYGYRSRALSDYPEGRRRCALEAGKKVGKKFNLVSANQNSRLSYDVQADLACMFEILDMLDKLEADGVTMIRMEWKAPVYGVLKDTTKNMFGKGPLRSYSAPISKSA